VSASTAGAGHKGGTSISAEHAGALVIRRADVDDPVANRLVDALQAHYVDIYGGHDATPYRPEEFRPPNGQFLLGFVDEVPVASGGWRWHTEPAVVEIKRMYVVPEMRRRGLARRMLTALENDAAAAGATAVVLMTGASQPEALAMYAAAGYRPVEPFGLYADEPTARHLGKRLPGARR
jgi:GNAT superfamily N-acetyltransferase